MCDAIGAEGIEPRGRKKRKGGMLFFSLLIALTWGGAHREALIDECHANGWEKIFFGPSVCAPLLLDSNE